MKSFRIKLWEIKLWFYVIEQNFWISSAFKKTCWKNFGMREPDITLYPPDKSVGILQYKRVFKLHFCGDALLRLTCFQILELKSKLMNVWIEGGKDFFFFCYMSDRTEASSRAEPHRSYQISLFSVHVNNEVGISNQIEDILSMKPQRPTGHCAAWWVILLKDIFWSYIRLLTYCTTGGVTLTLRCFYL